MSGSDRLAEVARLALIDLEAVPKPRVARADGLTIGQLFLHADIDPSLSAVGAGDNGGIATLLVRLGDALVADPSTGVERVITLSRGPVPQAAEDLLEIGSATSGHVYGRVPLLAAARAVGRGLAAAGHGAARHPSHSARRRTGRPAAPAHGRCGQPRRRRCRARARHPDRVHGRARPARRDPLARPFGRADPRALRRGRPARALLVPRPARDEPGIERRAHRAVPPAAAAARHGSARRHRHHLPPRAPHDRRRRRRPRRRRPRGRRRARPCRRRTRLRGDQRAARTRRAPPRGAARAAARGEPGPPAPGQGHGDPRRGVGVRPPARAGEPADHRRRPAASFARRAGAARPDRRRGPGRRTRDARA